MKLDQQCGVCRSYTWCGRMCRHAPTIYEAAADAAGMIVVTPKPAKKTKAEVQGTMNVRYQMAKDLGVFKALEEPVQSVPVPKAPKVAKPKKTPTEDSPGRPELCLDCAEKQREYMRGYQSKRRAKT